jgi:hypothetical protein
MKTIKDNQTPTANSTYKKLAVQWLNEALCFVSSLVLEERVFVSEIANFL